MIEIQVPTPFDRALNDAAAADGKEFMKALDNVVAMCPQPVLEGPSTIPKNTPGMGPAPQGVM